MTGTVASRIKELLSERDMTQKELAQRAGITESAVCHYVKGERVPRGTNLIKISSALNVTTDFLLGSEEENSEENSFAVVKTLIARNAERMSPEERMELMSILVGKQ